MLLINGERFNMTHAYAALQPDGFVPDQQSLMLVMSNRELEPDGYYALPDEGAHVIRLDVGPDRFLRSFNLVDETLKINSLSGVGIAEIDFYTWNPPLFAGFSPLAMAIESGSVETVEALLEGGVDPADQEMSLETLGIFAVRSGDPAMVRAPTGHVDFDRADSLGRTPVLAATEEGGAVMHGIIGILGAAGVDLSPRADARHRSTWLWTRVWPTR